MNAAGLERSIQEIWALFKETDQRFKKSQEDFDRRLKKSQEDFDWRLKKSQEDFDRRSREADREIAEVRKAIGDLGGKWGRFVEGVVAPGVERLFLERGIVLNRTHPRVKAHNNGQRMEIDLLAHNGDVAVLVEVKSTLSVNDVKVHLQQLADFKTFFPEYADRKLYGAVAGIVIEEGADRFAYQQELFVIAQSGETVILLNDEKFQPKIW